MMSTVHFDHQGPCPRPDCGGVLRKKLVDDTPGVHAYIWACGTCHHEHGKEWIEYHHGASRPLLTGCRDKLME